MHLLLLPDLNHHYLAQNGNELIIPCDAGTEKIDIYGSWAIPEFGVIAGVILAVAIASIIAVSAKSRLALVPKY